METHNEFLRSLKKQGQVIEELAQIMKIDESNCSRAGVGKILFQRIVSGNIPEPLDIITFGNLLRIFELKIPGFKKTDNCRVLEKAWEATRKAFCRNGGSPSTIPCISKEKPQQTIRKKSAVWIIAIFLKKLLEAHLFSQERFQKETGTSRWVLESLMEQEWDLYKDDEVISTLINYISPLLTDQEIALIKTALERKFLCLSEQEIEMICAPLSAEKIKECQGKFKPNCTWENKAWKNKTRKEILKELFSTAFSLRELLEGLLFLCELEIADLAEEADCSVKQIKDLMAGRIPVGKKVAKRMISAFDLEDNFATLFFEAVTTLKMPDCATLASPVPVQQIKELPTPPEDPREIFSSMLKEGRIAKTLSQSELAKKAECSQSTISKAENGLAFPPETIVRRIAKIFGFRNDKKATFYGLAGVNY